jgi:hypothetical protein
MRRILAAQFAQDMPIDFRRNIAQATVRSPRVRPGLQQHRLFSVWTQRAALVGFVTPTALPDIEMTP